MESATIQCLSCLLTTLRWFWMSNILFFYVRVIRTDVTWQTINVTWQYVFCLWQVQTFPYLTGFSFTWKRGFSTVQIDQSCGHIVQLIPCHNLTILPYFAVNFGDYFRNHACEAPLQSCALSGHLSPKPGGARFWGSSTTGGHFEMNEGLRDI